MSVSSSYDSPVFISKPCLASSFALINNRLWQGTFDVYNVLLIYRSMKVWRHQRFLFSWPGETLLLGAVH